MVLLLVPLSAYSLSNNCQSIQNMIEEAKKKRDQDDIDLKDPNLRNDYAIALNKAIENLKSCIEEIGDPIIILQLETIINSIEGRKKL